MLPIGAAAAPTIGSAPPTPGLTATAGRQGENVGIAIVGSVSTAPPEMNVQHRRQETILIAAQRPTTKPSQQRIADHRIAPLAPTHPTPSPPLRRPMRMPPSPPTPRHRRRETMAAPLPEMKTISAHPQTTPTCLVRVLVPSPI